MNVKREGYEANYKNIINYFNNNHDNQSHTIAKKLNLKVNYVSVIIDDYLSKKPNYMGESPTIITMDDEPKKRKGIGYKLYDSNQKHIFDFKSIKELAYFLNYSENSIYRKTKFSDNGFIYNKNKDEYYYIKLKNYPKNIKNS